jgi:hypothetical protein
MQTEMIEILLRLLAWNDAQQERLRVFNATAAPYAGKIRRNRTPAAQRLLNESSPQNKSRSNGLTLPA